MKLAPFVVSLALAALAPWAAAHETAAGAEPVRLVQRQPLGGDPGKEIVVVVVDYAPGQASTPHVHPGTVIAYVLEGEVASQVEGEPEITRRAGESWHEPPGVLHLVSRNASATQPAKLLAILVQDAGVPLKRPLPR